MVPILLQFVTKELKINALKELKNFNEDIILLNQNNAKKMDSLHKK